ncbi:hypothetical protein [Pedobacter psychrodurus]|uniref:hypothetical protein n=1 Tax=Pedobacter psychrodurus TaxID=2530456 RepID=UPI00292FB2EB|nr:hypothetical protein [Pedobacter psychrodurus]
MKTQSLKKLNPTITNWVISLHQKGYTDDFLSITPEKLQCVQNGESFALVDLRINLVDCSFDNLTHTFQYIHTIETQVGCRGLLIMNGILPLHN